MATAVGERSGVWRRGLRAKAGLVFVLFIGVLWMAFPAAALAYHNEPDGIAACDYTEGWEERCECLYHVGDLIDEQLRVASPDPTNPYESRKALQRDSDNRPVAWWRVESESEACARLDLFAAARGITRFLAGSVTGLVGISFVWSVVQMMQESVSGGRVVEARNNLFRTLVGLMFFGFSWIIYESITVGLFGVKQFTAGSFVGLTGHFGY